MGGIKHENGRLVYDIVLTLPLVIIISRRKFRSQTSDSMDRWEKEMGRVREEKGRRKKIKKNKVMKNLQPQTGPGQFFFFIFFIVLVIILFIIFSFIFSFIFFNHFIFHCFIILFFIFFIILFLIFLSFYFSFFLIMFLSFFLPVVQKKI